MRAMIVLALLTLAACADQPGPLTEAYGEYRGCLDKRPAAECDNQRQKFEAAKSYADSVSRRQAANNTYTGPAWGGSQMPPYPVQYQTQYPTRQAVSCIQTGPVTNCY